MSILVRHINISQIANKAKLHTPLLQYSYQWHFYWDDSNMIKEDWLKNKKNLHNKVVLKNKDYPKK